MSGDLITISKKDLEAIIQDAVKNEIEVKNRLNKKSHDPYLFQGVIDSYIKRDGKLEKVTPRTIAWKIWDSFVRKLVTCCMGVTYVKDIKVEDRERAIKLAEEILDCIVKSYESEKVEDKGGK